MSYSTFDSFFFKKYDLHSYNCMHFAIDVWQKLYRIDISTLCKAIVPKENGAYTVRSASPLRNFRRVPVPTKSPTLCLFRALGPDELHVGTYIDGCILHITEEGTQYLPEEITRIGFKEVTYYEYCNNHQ